MRQTVVISITSDDEAAPCEIELRIVADPPFEEKTPRTTAAAIAIGTFKAIAEIAGLDAEAALDKAFQYCPAPVLREGCRP